MTQSKLLSLFRLTYALQAKLPCELRDIVYNHVFDANTMREVHDYVFGSLDMKMDMIEVPLSSWPLYLYGGYTDEHIRVELIRYFCEHDPHLAVQHPRDLGALLRKEILASGIRLEHCALSALQVSGCIHLRTVDEFLDPKTILSEFAPLLSASQNFAASFRLTFHLHPYTDDILDHLEEIASENRKFRFEYLAVRMRNLGPAVRHIEERLKESGASRKVEVKLEFKRARHEDVVLEVSDEMMRSGWHGGKWAHLIIGWDECNQIRR
jgi:hypothetical protein